MFAVVLEVQSIGGSLPLTENTVTPLYNALPPSTHSTVEGILFLPYHVLQKIF